MMRGKRALDGLDEDIRDHIERDTEENIARGLSPDEARRQALIKFGNVTVAKEDTRAVWTWIWLEQLLQDSRYAFRTLRIDPIFTAAAVLTLALGIGANTAMFSVINATLLGALPFPDADRLMTVWKGSITDPESRGITSLPNYRDWKARNHTFADLALFDSAGRGYSLTGGGEAEQVSGVRVTASFFTVLGVPPLLGRTFVADEEDPGHDEVVVLSHGLWTRRFGADPSLVGRTIDIDGRAHTVVGVMPQHFRFQFWSGPRELWVPPGWTRGDFQRGSNSFVAIGRLNSDVTLANARLEMDTIGRSLAQDYPSDNPGQTIRLLPMNEFGVEDLRTMLVPMLAVVGVVLLIACVNVANLLLARAAARHRELAVKCALGASRGRLVRQLLTESIFLALVGGAGGLLIAWTLVRAIWGLTALTPILRILTVIPLRPLDGIALDQSVLLFTLAVSCLSGVLFGLAPALTSFRRDLNAPLRGNARGSTPSGRSRLRHALVASEVALTLVTLAGAGVLIVSVTRLLGVNPGLDPRNVLVMDMSLPQQEIYYGPPDHPRFCQNLEQQVGGLPGVLSVSGIAHLPLGGGGAGRGLTIEGRPDPGPRNQPGAGYTVACPNILRTLGIPLLAGREFAAHDSLGAPDVVIVNEAMAQRFWPGEPAVGKRFKIGTFQTTGPWLTIVGVFTDVRSGGLDREPRPTFYRPYAQAGWPSLSIVVKTTAAPATSVTSVKKALAVIEPNHPVSLVRTMEQVVSASVSPRRLPMLLFSGIAVLALTLAAIGISGVVGYSVVQRSQEIGVRVMLGAQSRDVLRLMVGDSLGWTLVGVGAGLTASIGLLRFMQTLLYDITPADPVVLGAVSLLLVGVALAATYIPARRALRVDPVGSLRCG
jgi:putative ABC transport system permease protein